MHYFVSHLAPHAAAGATGIVQTGSYLGSAVGPALTGLMLSTGHSTTAWTMLSTMAVVAATLSVLVGQRLRNSPTTK
jgi:cyanate permease